ncbi:MAG: 2-amino-4-hydroxy-6-hydroxymethyldihydropteridine diphosphokinase [Alphaproteobacteria bacterium]
MAKVALALGSNIGDRRQNLRTAVEALEERTIVEDVWEAPVYESDPMYVEDQATFMNSVVVGNTSLTPPALLSALKALENDLGREASIRNGPRLIDLDIIIYDDQVITEETLEIPHPRMHERPFVLQPLSQVWPGWRHPASGATACEMWTDLAALPSAEGSLRKVADRIR